MQKRTLSREILILFKKSLQCVNKTLSFREVSPLVEKVEYL